MEKGFLNRDELEFSLKKLSLFSDQKMKIFLYIHFPFMKIAISFYTLVKIVSSSRIKNTALYGLQNLGSSYFILFNQESKKKKQEKKVSWIN